MVNQAVSDPSRYVLPDDVPYLRNLAALGRSSRPWRRQSNRCIQRPATTCNHPKAAHQPFPCLGHRAPTFCCIAGIGQSMKPSGSSRQRSRTSPSSFYFFGFGLGYHVERLFDGRGEEAIFCVFEPDLLLLRTAFENARPFAS